MRIQFLAILCMGTLCACSSFSHSGNRKATQHAEPARDAINAESSASPDGALSAVHATPATDPVEELAQRITFDVMQRDGEHLRTHFRADVGSTISDDAVQAFWLQLQPLGDFVSIQPDGVGPTSGVRQYKVRFTRGAIEEDIAQASPGKASYWHFRVVDNNGLTGDQNEWFSAANGAPASPLPSGQTVSISDLTTEIIPYPDQTGTPRYIPPGISLTQCVAKSKRTAQPNGEATEIDEAHFVVTNRTERSDKIYVLFYRDRDDPMSSDNATSTLVEVPPQGNFTGQIRTEQFFAVRMDGEGILTDMMRMHPTLKCKLWYPA